VSRSGANPTYSPSQLLTQRYALAYNWEPDKLAASLTEFGPLPEEGQEQLIRCLVLAYGRYQVLAKSIARIPPSRIRNQLAAIKATIQKLLLQLGVNPNKVRGGTNSGELRSDCNDYASKIKADCTWSINFLLPA
jgi:hypothetical protein